VSFKGIKNDSELFMKFTEVLNGGIEMLLKSRDITDNLWIIKAAITVISGMCSHMIIENGITKEQLQNFENEMEEYIEDLYQEFVVNRNSKNEL